MIFHQYKNNAKKKLSKQAGTCALRRSKSATKSQQREVILNTSYLEEKMEPSIASEFNYDIQQYYANKKEKLLMQYQMIHEH